MTQHQNRAPTTLDEPFGTDPGPDLHGYIVKRLDAHLAELTRLRNELCVARAAQPGARRQAAAASISASEQYTHDIVAALS